MPKQAYDHHKKAGNQGDVVKHIALIAALDSLLDTFPRKTFNYADTFAGYAHNPLVRGNEWTQGIGKLFGRPEPGDNPHTALYAKWYLSRPQLVDGMYPGSSLIAFDVCAWKRKNSQLFLWDTDCACVEDLRRVFHSQDRVRIFHYEALLDQKEARLAHFLLIDPPNAKAHWGRIVPFLKSIQTWLILWLPVNAAVSKGKVNEDSQSTRCRIEALKLGFTVSKVRWAKGGRMIGCQLIYRLPLDATQAQQAAVTHVANILKWKTRHYDPRRLARIRINERVRSSSSVSPISGRASSSVSAPQLMGRRK